jgi:large repetitive protein
MKPFSSFTAILLLFIAFNAFSQLDFKTPITPPDQLYPQQMTKGHFDSNGLVDMAYTTDDKLYVLFNKGGFEFDTVTVKGVTVNSGVHPLTSGDLNNDGRAEIIVYDNSVTKSKVIVVTNVNDVFTSKRYDVIDEYIISKALVVGDYNNDGTMDIICGTDSGPAQILAGTPTGTFNLQQVDLSESILDIAVTDLNNDGKNDFVACNYSTQVITYIASGTSYTKKLYTGTKQYNKLVVADFNGDGWKDVVASPFAGSALHLFANNGTGTLTRSEIPCSLQTRGWGLDAADFNSDGRMDIVSIGYDPSKPVLFANVGNNIFEEYHIVLSPERYALDCHFIDLENDGVPEIVTLSGTKAIDILKFSGGDYLTVRHLILGTSPFRALLTDLNADSHVDLVTSTPLGKFMSVYYGNSTGSYPTRKDYPIDGEVSDLQTGDFNSDGFNDIVYTTNSAAMSSTGIFLSASDGTLSSTPVDLASEYSSMARVADFNADGKLDVVTAFSMYRGNGDGTFNASSYSAPNNVYMLDVGDLDGDGFVDLFVSDGNALHVALNDGQGNCTVFEPVETQAKIQTMRVALLNNDSLADIIIGNPQGDSITVLLSGANGFVSKTIHTGFANSSVVASDFDNDGRMDILAGVKYAQSPDRWTLAVYLQDSNHEFIFYQNISIENFSMAIATGDINQDTYPDIVSVSPNGSAVKIVLADFTTQPLQPATGVSVNVGLYDAVVSLTAGGGEGRIMIVREAQAVNSVPADKFFYSANSTFKSGSKIGDDNYVVLLADQETVQIKGLKSGTTYYLKIYEYNVNDRNTIINYAAEGTPFSFATKKLQSISVVADFTLPESKKQTIVVSASSGLPVSLTLLSGDATVSHDSIFVKGPGPVRASALQSGNAVYYQAADTLSFCARPPKPLITLNDQQADLRLVSSNASNNQWFKDGVAITGATSQNFTPTESGAFTVKVDYGACYSVSDAFALLITGSETAVEKAVHIYPNPASTEIKITSAELLYSVTIQDVLGKVIYCSTGNVSEHVVPVDAVANGLLFVILKTPKGNVVRKVVKQ